MELISLILEKLEERGESYSFIDETLFEDGIESKRDGKLSELAHRAR